MLTGNQGLALIPRGLELIPRGLALLPGGLALIPRDLALIPGFMKMCMHYAKNLKLNHFITIESFWAI